MRTDAEYRSRYENDMEEDNEDVTKRRRTVKKWSKEEVSAVLTCISPVPEVTRYHGSLG